MPLINTFTFATASFYNFSKTTGGETASGTTIQLNEVFIPANSFVPGDIVEILALNTDNSSATTGTVTIFWGAGTNSIAQAKQLGQYTYTSGTSELQPFQRFLHIVSTTVTYTFATASSLATQYSPANYADSTNTTAMTTIDINWGVDSYIFARGSATGLRNQYIYVTKR